MNIAELISAAGPILVAVLGILVEHISVLKSSKEVKLCLLRNDLRSIWLAWHDKSAIPVDVMDEFNKTYELYHKLGGNGTATRMKGELEKLPMKGE